MKFDQVELEQLAEEGNFSEEVKSFVAKIEADNETLFAVSEKQIENFYKSRSKAELVKHFTGRMVNERMNMVELAKQVANAGTNMDPKDLQLLSKQVLDEANHFRMTKDVVEYLNGGPINVEESVEWDLENNQKTKGAKLLETYDCENDEIALALYQLIAEGRAARNWAMMSQCVTDPFISKTYAKIARDEKFHSKMGRRNLLKVCDTQEKMDYALSLANKMRLELFEVNCNGTGELPGSRELIEQAYGKTTRETSVFA
jgi:rubrerythrin